MSAQRPVAQHVAPNGEAVLLRELFEEYRRMVLVVCRVFLRDREEVEDAAQQTFLAAYQGLLTGNEPRHPAAWLATIARNECRARLKGDPALTRTATEPDGSRSDDIVDLVGLKAMLAELPKQQREVVALHCFYGLSYREVAAELEVSHRAVDGLLSRARRHLRRRLRDSYGTGTLLLPDVLRERLTQIIPGFEHSGAAAAALPAAVSAPVAAKLAVAAAGVAVLGTGGVPDQGALGLASKSAERHASPVRRAVPPAPANTPRVVVTRAVSVVAPRHRSSERRSDDAGDDSRGPGSGRADSSGPGSGEAKLDERGDSSGPGKGASQVTGEAAALRPRTDDSGPENAGSGNSGSGSSGSSGSKSSSSKGSDSERSSSKGSGSKGSGSESSRSMSSGSGSSGSGSGSSGSGSSGSESSGSGSSGSGSSGSGSSGSEAPEDD